LPRRKQLAGVQRYVIQQSDIVVAGFCQVLRIDADKVCLIVLRQLIAFKNEAIGTNADLIAHLQESICRQLGVDVDMVSAVLIDNAIRAALPYQASMMRGNLGMGQDDGVICLAPDSKLRSA
jgi:hypothetical protein